MALSNLTSLKLHLGITDTSQDTILQQWIDEVDAAIKNECDLLLEQPVQSVIEFVRGNGQIMLTLRQTPVQKLVGVRLDNTGNFGATSGGFGSGTALVEGADYALVPDHLAGYGWSSSGMVARINGVWDRFFVRSRGRLASGPMLGIGNIRVEYWPGFPTYIVTAAVVAGGGSGYAVDDTITLAGGTSYFGAVVTVTAVASGVITSVRVTTPGSYTVVPTNPASQSSTSGDGSGATFTLTTASGLPKDLELLANECIAQVKARRRTGMMLQSENFRDYGYSLSSPGQFLQTASAQGILSKYKRLAI